LVKSQNCIEINFFIDGFITIILQLVILNIKNVFLRKDTLIPKQVLIYCINKNIKIFDMSSDHPNQEYLKWIKYNKKMEDTIKSLMLDLIK